MPLKQFPFHEEAIPAFRAHYFTFLIYEKKIRLIRIPVILVIFQEFLI